jgi:predicted transcriptional regulator
LNVRLGVRKNGNKTTTRIAVAIELAKSGLRKAEIARQLGISPSTISKWIKRKPDLAETFS